MGRVLTPRRLFVGLLAAAVGGALIYLFAFGSRPVPEAAELRAFVSARPPVPVVFTSRTTAAGFVAAAPEADGFKYPGTIPWAAESGRLRLLEPDGKVYELTWDRPLPDGGTLIDVMSPSVTLDGKRVLFAGRKAAPDPGRWRIYEVRVDGGDLRQLTGLAGDPGCVALPPLRYAADGSALPSAERLALDYDDVDPTDLGEGGIAFASSRIPDLGSGHSRRATQIWVRPKGATAPRPLTANRNNDRWPFLAGDNLILFSLWSRNREAVTEDLTGLRPVTPSDRSATSPTDSWVGARVMPDGSQFGYGVKIAEPVWRPRALFNGRVAFMTDAGNGVFRLAQADWGYLRSAPSSLAVGTNMPAQVGGEMDSGPDLDSGGRPLSAGCPSPCPSNMILFAGTPVGAPVSAYGLYLVPEEWVPRQTPQLLFDDPQLVDAEPVAAYPRDLNTRAVEPPAVPEPAPGRLPLADGGFHTGPMGRIENNHVNVEMSQAFPGQRTDAGTGPVIPHPTGVRSVAFYAANRDRFDDPVRPRVPGTWEKLLVAPLDARAAQPALRTWLPADPLTPTVLAGLGADGKVFGWTGAKDSAGKAAKFYAVAGDHYSGTRPNGYHFCIGCHTGHTFITADIRERVK